MMPGNISTLGPRRLCAFFFAAASEHNSAYAGAPKYSRRLATRRPLASAANTAASLA